MIHSTVSIYELLKFKIRNGNRFLERFFGPQPRLNFTAVNSPAQKAVPTLATVIGTLAALSQLNFVSP
jgi:hypothetical protein